MTSRESNRFAEIAFATLVCVIISFGGFLSVSTGDPHWLDRAGAAVAAFSAGAVLYQIIVEVKIEEQRGKLSEDMHRIEEGLDQLSPIGLLETRLVRKRMERMQSTLIHDRLRVATFVVIGAMVGEALHGFGDLIACRVLHVCVSAG
jgi:hypothetical protein